MKAQWWTAGVVLLGLAACGEVAGGQQRARGPLNYPPLPAGVSIQRNIHYEKYAGTVLDILAPKTRLAGGRPGVVVFHGGGWIHTGKETAYESLCLPYLERGFVVANVEYRVAAQATAPAAVTDALEATHWFFKHARELGMDPKRIVVTGGSAGGHLALMVGMTPKSAHLGPVSPVAAVVDGYGITDAVDLLNGPHHQTWANDWIPTGPQCVELARKVSPMTYVRHDLPPILIAQGADDHTVPVEQAIRLHNALDMDGAANELMIVPNAGHGFSREQWGPLDEKIFAFLAAHGIVPPEDSQQIHPAN
ncbi:MAG TPA: alpha/beta hydrolase [Terracidiphilus sp.]|nr:alpha/beta hydrolase [Terracidiphilus sp.]